MNKSKLMNTLTQENNRLIAEFEGFETYEGNGYINVHYSDDNVRTIVDTHYHSSWDWLMPVVVRCLNEENTYSVSKEGGWDYKRDIHYMLNDAVMTIDIDEVYKAVVEFIKQQKT